MPKGTGRPYNRKRVRDIQAKRFFDKASKEESSMGQALLTAAGIDTLSGKRKAYKRRKK